MDETEETRRKRLRFRCWHRGSREADLLLGRFADRYLDRLDAAGLDQLERLLGECDADIWDWATGRAPIPESFDHSLMRLLRRFPQPLDTC